MVILKNPITSKEIKRPFRLPSKLSTMASDKSTKLPPSPCQMDVDVRSQKCRTVHLRAGQNTQLNLILFSLYPWRLSMA